MSKFWSSLLNRLTPYEAGEQPQDQSYIKLNTNENPYPPSPKAIKKIKSLAADDLRLYPDPESWELKDSISAYYKIKPHNVFVGNGSDEVLAHIFHAFFSGGKPLLFPDITYSFYPVYCELYGITPKKIPLSDNFQINLMDYDIQNGGIIFPNPNAPTGLYIETETVEQLLQKNKDSLVVVDEAYIDFGGKSCASLINKYHNLIVVQTFSKSRSLAGMRIGFALAHKDLIRGLDTIKDSFNSYPIDRLAAGAAIEAIKDEEYFTECCNKIIKTREWTSKKLISLGFEVLPSKANFIMAGHKEHDAGILYQALKNEGILVRHFKNPLINNYLRITIGTDNEMDTFIKRLSKLLEQQSA